MNCSSFSEIDFSTMKTEYWILVSHYSLRELVTVKKLK